MHHPMLNIAIKAARSGSKIMLRHLEHLDTLKISTKGLNDFVTEVDNLVEKEIIKIIREKYPEHALLTEESGSAGKNDYLWIVDPLDGTINYMHGIPCFAISIAIKYKGSLQHCVTYDPVSGELFIASRGGGAYLNDRRIRVSKLQNLKGSILGIGFPYRKQNLIKFQLDSFAAIFPHVSGFRAIGSATLALAYVAAGRLDGLWICCLNEWDLAAGSLLIQEAGGLVSDFFGAENFANGNIIAGNAKILKALLKHITPLAQTQGFDS